MIYHEMRVEEDFEKAASRIFTMIRTMQSRFPGAERFVYLTVQGHRNADGGFDHDAFELMHNFLLQSMNPYLTELRTPLIHVNFNHKQSNELPDSILFAHYDASLEYDDQSLKARPREDSPATRASRPSTNAIAEYLGTDQACMICGAAPAERAHVVPKALGGSNDVRNFALLCREHHAEAPDVADAEAFWSWMDYRCASYVKTALAILTPEEQKHLGAELMHKESTAAAATHFAKVREELVAHYGWSDSDFSDLKDWGSLLDEFHQVVEQATTKHFGLESKSSTEAWAYDVARRRLTGTSPSIAHRLRRHAGDEYPAGYLVLNAFDAEPDGEHGLGDTGDRVDNPGERL